MMRSLQLSSLLAAAAWAPGAMAQSLPVSTLDTTLKTTNAVGDPKPAGAESPAKAVALLSMDPADPQVGAMPGGTTPAFGADPTKSTDWRFDFHGMLFAPLRVGISSREQLAQGQSKTTLHAPPVVAEDFDSFRYTGVAPNPWAQVNFSYGNKDVTANIIVAARTMTNGTAYFNPPDQLGINDAFLTFRVPEFHPQLRVKLDVGAFANRYGNMGEYDAGRYGTAVIARIGGVGATGMAKLDLGNAVLMAEAGFMGQLNKAPLGVQPAGWNGYLEPNVGTSFVPHFHAGLSFGVVHLGGHFVRALSQDDRATPNTQPDGNIDVTAVDARLTMHRFGHFYAAFARTSSHHAAAVSQVIRILNVPGGPGLMEQYFGANSQGSGDLNTLAAQYDLSIGNLLRYPEAYHGNAPDLFASVFGIYTNVKSADPAYNNVDKLKYGAELTYGPLPWLAVSGRYDRVMANMNDSTQTSAIVSPRVIFRSGYNARDQVALQYSHYFNGSNVHVKTGSPPVIDPTARLDQDVVSLMASMWW